MKTHWLYATLVFGVVACSNEHAETTPPATQATVSPQRDSISAANTVTQGSPIPGTIAVEAVPPAQVPPALRQPGRLVEAWHWKDTNGENLLLITQSAVLPDHPLPPRAGDAPAETMEDQGEKQQTLAARQYVRQAGQPYRELWHLGDAVEHCPFDVAVALRPHSTAITDLNHDGQTETTLMYSLGCRSDVSPDDLKLITHEGTAKYALRGYTVVQFDSIPARQRQPAAPCCLNQLSKVQLEKLYDAAGHAGRYFSEAEFRSKPEFLRFARQQWQRFSVVVPEAEEPQ